MDGRFRPDYEPRILAALYTAAEPLSVWEIMFAMQPFHATEVTIAQRLDGLATRGLAVRSIGVRSHPRHSDGYPVKTRPRVWTLTPAGRELVERGTTTRKARV